MRYKGPGYYCLKSNGIMIFKARRVVDAVGPGNYFRASNTVKYWLVINPAHFKKIIENIRAANRKRNERISPQPNPN